MGRFGTSSLSEITETASLAVSDTAATFCPFPHLTLFTSSCSHFFRVFLLQILAPLHLSYGYSQTIAGALSGALVVFLDPSSIGFELMAVVTPGEGAPISTYAVNTTTYRVLYPSSACYRGFVSFCNLTTRLTDTVEYAVASTLRAGEIRFGPIAITPGPVASRHTSAVTAFRDPVCPWF